MNAIIHYVNNQNDWARGICRINAIIHNETYRMIMQEPFVE